MKSKNVTVKRRISIVSVLNIRIWFRLIGIFLVLNVFLIVTAALSLLSYAEVRIAEVTESIRDPIQLSQESMDMLAGAGISLYPHLKYPSGFKVPALLRIVFPESTVDGARRFTLLKSEDVGLYRRLDSLSYQLERSFNGSTYGVVLALRPVVQMLKAFFIVLFSIQFVYGLRSLLTTKWIISKTLHPIVELAEKAQTLTTKQGPYSPEEMKALAGKLESIDAARLDTRIEIDGAQDELKIVSAAINSMLDRINDSYRSQARFVSDASHELRTPIAAIQGYANLLDRWGKNDKQALQESIDAIKDEAGNMKDLIEQLLFLARGDNHRMPLQEECVNLADLVQTLFRETQMIDSSHQFESRLAPVYVYVDSSLIKQALRILVDNAIKYTPVGGEIILAVSKKNGKAWLTVQDNGIGIPPEAVPRIFDRFYRADESRARETGGTGLGLSIAKWIIQRHGGLVEVVSREDVGTRISFVIPAIEDSPASRN